MRIGVIGCGVIGKAMLAAAKKVKVECIGFDPFLPEFGPLTERVLLCDVVFVSVPTPTRYGFQDQIPLVKVATELSNFNYKGVVCVRSTVLPGTCKQIAEAHDLRVTHMPEFLTEANAAQDFLNQEKLYISGNQADRIKVLEAMFLILPVPVTGWKILLDDDTRVTEVQKYFANCHKAIKVVISNVIAEACQKQGIDYAKVRHFAGEVNGVGKNHTAVPGPDGKPGYSGMCFVKDMVAFDGWLKGSGADNSLFRAAIISNEAIRPHDEFCKEK